MAARTRTTAADAGHGAARDTGRQVTEYNTVEPGVKAEESP